MLDNGVVMMPNGMLAKEKSENGRMASQLFAAMAKDRGAIFNVGMALLTRAVAEMMVGAME
jgi:hypothetical protein